MVHDFPLTRGLVTVDSPRSQALVGFVKANGIATSNLVVTPANDFCAVTLSALDDAPIAGSSRLLLTAGARVENTDHTGTAKAPIWRPTGGAPRPR